MIFRLPASGQQPREISFISQDQYACASQKWPAPRKDFLGERVPPRYSLQLFSFIERRKQPLGADAQVHRCFGVLGLLRYINALLQPRNLYASDGEGAIKSRGVPGFLGGFYRGGDHSASNYGTPKIVGSSAVPPDQRGDFPRGQQGPRTAR